MRDQKLYESVGKYIDKYYIDKPCATGEFTRAKPIVR